MKEVLKKGGEEQARDKFSLVNFRRERNYWDGCPEELRRKAWEKKIVDTFQEFENGHSSALS
jgi:hypothetical protein